MFVTITSKVNQKLTKLIKRIVILKTYPEFNGPGNPSGRRSTQSNNTTRSQILLPGLSKHSPD